MGKEYIYFFKSFDGVLNSLLATMQFAKWKGGERDNERGVEASGQVMAPVSYLKHPLSQQPFLFGNKYKELLHFIGCYFKLLVLAIG